jgi:hypothetical protein
MGVRAVFRTDAGLVVTSLDSPLAPFEAQADGLTVRVTAQTEEVTELLDEDVDVRLGSLKLVGFDDGSGYRDDVRIVGHPRRPNLLLQDVGGVFGSEAWPSITERVRRHEDVPVERALLLDAQALVKTAAYDQALVLAAVVVEGLLPDLVVSVLEAVGGRSGCPEGEALLHVLEHGGTHPLGMRSARAVHEILMALYEPARRRARIDLPLTVRDNPLEAMIAVGEV